MFDSEAAEIEEFFGALTGGALGLAVRSLALEEFELLEEDTLLPEELGRVVPELPGETAIPPWFGGGVVFETWLFVDELPLLTWLFDSFSFGRTT